MSSDIRTGRRYRWFPSVVVFVLVVLVGAGCAFPRDPRGTLERVQNGTMRVGIVENDPWARMEAGHASGVEVELLKGFTRELGAEVSFVPGTAPELLEAAKEAEVDVPLGENGWLVELERFLRVYRGEAKSLLRKESS